jgi:glycosyltransferase involved in cell wall biosynthesis
MNAAATRVALIADYREERWYSMDLVADMLYRHINQLDGSNLRVKLLCPRLLPLFSSLPGIGSHRLGENADRLLNRMVAYPAWLRRRAHAFDVFHIVDHSYSQLALQLPPSRTVISCHDLDAFRCLLEPASNPRPWWFRAFTRRILDGFRRVAAVICGTHAVRDELLAYRLIEPARVTVIPIGVDPACTAFSDLSSDAEAAALLPAGPAYLLHVGSTVSRKRIDILLRVLESVRPLYPGLRLVRVGGPLTASQQTLAEKLGVAGAITTLPAISKDVLAAVYRRAALLLQPSDAEGFGLPVIEAMACGCPVLASDLTVLREVGGAAAEYCPPGSPSEWSRATIRLLEERERDPARWESRRRAAMERSNFFTWMSAAEGTAAVYRMISGAA